jgi:DNA repair photolyase
MKYYGSPRWSGEILDCSMPMTFDTYSKCSFDCLYCFSYFQRQCRGPNDLRWVNTGSVKRLFTEGVEKTKHDLEFKKYIEDRIPMQWGGLADQFDMYEKKHGVTLELLKFFKSINYPLCFSTKSTWWTDDERYTELFSGQTNWNVKVSIINLDERSAKSMERGVPSPQSRLDAIRKIASLGSGGATLRLRPFILGHSDKNNDYLNLIKEAAAAGATAVSTEFMCLESRATQNLKERYNKISEIIGMDIYKLYRKLSTGNGYLRLNKTAKLPFIRKMKDLCDSLGLRFYVSDAHFKELCPNGSCCGLGPEWNYYRGQLTEALCIAKKNGKVSLGDILKSMDATRDVLMKHAINTAGSMAGAARQTQTMAQYLQQVWNTPAMQKSPYRYFHGALRPIGLDDDKNIIYKYMGEITP